MAFVGIDIETGKLYPVYAKEADGIVTSKQTTNPSTSSDAKSQTQKKSQNTTKAQVNEYVEGTIGVLPNSAYTPRKIYKLNGVGRLFHGMYYTKRATHTISGDSYSVELEVLLVQKIVADNKTKQNVELEVKAQENPNFDMITIKAGDTLWSLARKYGSTVDYLAEINNIKNPDLIYTGNMLKVPSN